MSRFDFRKYFFTTAILILLGTGVSSAHTEGTLCSDAEISDVNSTLRLYGNNDLERQCFVTEVPSSGLLMLEAAVPSTAAVEPRLDVLGHRCDSAIGAAPSARTLTRIANRQLLEVSQPGAFQFCVTPQDPEKTLDDYRVFNHFVAADFAKDDGNEHEPDPDPFAGSNGCRVAVASAFTKDDGNEHEPDPDPFGGPTKPCDRRSLEKTRELCKAQQVDDVADTALCATWIDSGKGVIAEIGNSWRDDSDWYTFDVGTLTTIHIESFGSTAVLGGLYSDGGLLLATGQDAGPEGNFRMVKTLSPGRYFVQVTGSAGSEGRYGLSVNSIATDNL